MSVREWDQDFPELHLKLSVFISGLIDCHVHVTAVPGVKVRFLPLVMLLQAHSDLCLTLPSHLLHRLNFVIPSLLLDDWRTV